MDNNTPKSLEQIRDTHLKQHAGYIWDCRRIVDGQECRHQYQDALIRESEQQIAAQEVKA